MPADLTQAERAYFVRKAGGATPTEPLQNIKRRYIAGFVGAGITPQMNIKQVEKLWLLKILANAGVTPTDRNSNETLWKQVVSSISQTPSVYLADNKLKFYLNAA